MVIRIVGKQSFVSKNGTQCNIIHYLYKNDNVEGSAVDHSFVNDQVFSRVVLNQNFKIVYGCSFSGKATIDDLVPVE